MEPDYIQAQQKLLDIVKTKSKQKLVDLLMETLNVSSDSAYRRIRKEKIFTLDEIMVLCKTFNLSFDNIMTSATESSVIFSFDFPDSNYDFVNYLHNAHKNLLKVKEKGGTLYYSAKDIPVFHVFQSKKLTAFKVYYWMRTMSNQDKLAQEKFSFDLLPTKFYELTTKLYLTYTEINSHEIWNYETIHSTTAQIHYYYDSGLITKQQAEELLEELKGVFSHIKDEAEEEMKFIPGNKPVNNRQNFNFYFNEIIAADNSIYAEFGDSAEAFKPHIVLNFMTTQNDRYCDFIKSVFDNVIKKSTLISGVNERDRNRFFRYNFERIDKTKTQLDY